MGTLSTPGLSSPRLREEMLPSEPHRERGAGELDPGFNGTLLSRRPAASLRRGLTTDLFRRRRRRAHFADGSTAAALPFDGLADGQRRDGRGRVPALQSSQPRELDVAGGPGASAGGGSARFRTACRPGLCVTFAAGPCAVPAGRGLSGRSPGAATANVGCTARTSGELFASGRMPSSMGRSRRRPSVQLQRCWRRLPGDFASRAAGQRRRCAMQAAALAGGRARRRGARLGRQRSHSMACVGRGGAARPTRPPPLVCASKIRAARARQLAWRGRVDGAAAPLRAVVLVRSATASTRWRGPAEGDTCAALAGATSALRRRPQAHQAVGPRAGARRDQPPQHPLLPKLALRSAPPRAARRRSPPTSRIATSRCSTSSHSGSPL